MENRKIKFPIAAIFIIIDLFLSVIGLAISFKYYTEESRMSVLFNDALVYGCRLILCCLLFRKKQDKILLIGTCTLAIPRLVF